MIPVLLAVFLAVPGRAVPPAFEAAQASFLRGSANDGFHEALGDMMAMGASRPWPEALEAATGTRQMDATAVLEYFAPLKVWLDEQNKGQTVGCVGRLRR